jgi:hypothetical protein
MVLVCTKFKRQSGQSKTVRFVHSCTLHGEKSLSYTNYKPSQSNGSGISVPTLKFSPKYQDGIHVDVFKKNLLSE